jgi:small subunit ribosomal protein S4
MARYTGPRYRLSRAYGVNLDPDSGIRPIEDKCRFTSLPGKGTTQRRGKFSNYALQKNMKQMMRHHWGVLERQFKRYYREADRRSGSTGDNLLLLLESRLDNVVYRMGFGVTRREARQLITHRAVTVNGQIVDKPSYSIKPGDVVEIREKCRSQVRIQASIELSRQRPDFEWLEVDYDQFSGVFVSRPDPEQFHEMFKVNLVVELYSK